MIELPERFEIMALQLDQLGIDRGQLEMRIGKGAAVAGDVLHHRQHAAGQQPLGGRPPERGHDIGLLAIGARADHVAGALDRHIEHRQAVGRDAVSRQVKGMQASKQPSRAFACVVIVAPKRAERGAGRIVGRKRRPQALHAPALLIDEDRRILPSDAIAHLGDQIADLLRFADIARKQDEAPRAFAAIEADFLAAERSSLAPEDHGF